MTPDYLAADCQLSSKEGHCQLRSAGQLEDLCHHSSGGPTATLGTNVSRLLVQGRGTVFSIHPSKEKSWLLYTSEVNVNKTAIKILQGSVGLVTQTVLGGLAIISSSCNFPIVYTIIA